MTLVLDEHLIRFFNQTKDIYGDEIFLNYNDPSKDNSHSSFSSNITSFENQINKCHKCDLGNSRTNFVFGVGDPDLAGDVYVRRFKNLTSGDANKWQALREISKEIPEGFGVKIEWH